MIILLIVFALIITVASKPDDKTCIIEGVRAVWGNRVPDVSRPVYFEQFMDLMSKDVEVNDWILVKRIRYQLSDEKKVTVGYGAFKRVFITY